MLIEDNLAFTVDVAETFEIPVGHQRDITEQITQSFPVMLICKGNKGLLVNLHELVLSPMLLKNFLMRIRLKLI